VTIKPFLKQAILLIVLASGAYAQGGAQMFGGSGPPRGDTPRKNQIIKKKKLKLLNTELFKFKNMPSGYIVKKNKFLLECEFGLPGASRFQIQVNDGAPYRGNVVDGRFSYNVDLSWKDNGVNEISVAVAGDSGVMGWTVVKLIYSLSAKKRLEELGKIEFTSPEYGYELGFFDWSIWVEGKIDIPDIKKAQLFVNDLPRNIVVKDGKFREKVSTFGGKKLLLRIEVEDTYGRKMLSTYHIVYKR